MSGGVSSGQFAETRTGLSAVEEVEAAAQRAVGAFNRRQTGIVTGRSRSSVPLALAGFVVAFIATRIVRSLAGRGA